MLSKGRWQATCYYHRKNETTRCTHSVQIRGTNEQAEIDRSRLLVMKWCLLAPLFNRQRSHKLAVVMDNVGCTEEMLNARMQMMPDPPTALELMDQTLNRDMQRLQWIRPGRPTASQAPAARALAARGLGAPAATLPVRAAPAALTVRAGEACVLYLGRAGRGPPCFV